MKILKRNLKYKIRRLIFIYIPITTIYLYVNTIFLLDFIKNIDIYMM
jgi:hypothetical protein